MNCPETCPQFCFTLSPDCPLRFGSASSNTLKEGPPVTTYPTGSSVPGVQCQPPRLSGRDKALMLLNEAYNEVSSIENGRVRSLVLTKIEEAEMWLQKVCSS